jgi:hypothetical protein
MSKSVVARLAAVFVSAVVGVTTGPAQAAFFHGGGFGGFHGGGFGGFHSPGMGMGAFRPGGFGAFHPGFNGFRPGFNGRFANSNFFINRNVFIGGHGGCWGRWCGSGWWWPGFASGAIIGAAATYPYYDYGYGYPDYAGYDNGCWVYRPSYNRYGRYIGRRLVNVCY